MKVGTKYIPGLDSTVHTNIQSTFLNNAFCRKPQLRVLVWDLIGTKHAKSNGNIRYSSNVLKHVNIK